MKFYHRLDWQLAITIVILFLATITLTGLLRNTSVQILISRLTETDQQQATMLRSKSFLFEKQVKELSLAKMADELLKAITQETKRSDYIYIITSPLLEILADSGGEYVHVELVRQEPTGSGYTVVISSAFQKQELFQIYPEAQALNWHNQLMVFAVPNPVEKIPTDNTILIAQDLNQHLKNYWPFYLSIVAFILLFLRWRLKPLRALEASACRLSLHQLPPPLPTTSRQDEVGSLVNAFNLALERLKQEQKKRTLMLSDIAHELRTPLTNIAGRLEAEEIGVTNDKERLLAFTRQHVDHLVALVEDIDLLTSVEYGEFQLNRQPTRLLALVEDECHVAAYNYDFEWQVSGDDVVINLDGMRFRQILKNLIQNAVKAKPQGLKLNIHMQQNSDKLEMTFEDNGPGVAEQCLEKIFDRLFRTDSSRNEKTGGAGLGLSIVRRLIELHGGNVTSFLPAAGGLGFNIVLPLTFQPTSTQ